MAYYYLLMFVSWFFLVVLVHEMGHAWMAQKLGYKPVIKGFSTVVNPNPNRKHHLLILYSGFCAGLIAVLIYFVAAPHVIFAGTMLAVYLFGSRTDLKEMWRNNK